MVTILFRFKLYILYSLHDPNDEISSIDWVQMDGRITKKLLTRHSYCSYDILRQ
jgi:hypothetical protein